MGQGTRSGRFGQLIRTFHPDDTHNTVYIADGGSMEDIWNKVQEKWPGIQMSELSVEPQHIQTDCLGYDGYDPGDYTNFLCITASDSYFKKKK